MVEPIIIINSPRVVDTAAPSVDCTASVAVPSFVVSAVDLRTAVVMEDLAATVVVVAVEDPVARHQTAAAVVVDRSCLDIYGVVVVGVAVDATGAENSASESVRVEPVVDQHPVAAVQIDLLTESAAIAGLVGSLFDQLAYIVVAVDLEEP